MKKNPSVEIQFYKLTTTREKNEELYEKNWRIQSLNLDPLVLIKIWTYPQISHISAYLEFMIAVRFRALCIVTLLYRPIIWGLEYRITRDRHFLGESWTWQLFRYICGS